LYKIKDIFIKVILQNEVFLGHFVIAKYVCICIYI
jgi:hypothetical protein